MIKVTTEPILPELLIGETRTTSSGCVAAYIGLIRDRSHGRPVLSVEYRDADGAAEKRLGDIADEIRKRWPVNSVSIYHRIGKLRVGDINFLVAVAAAHRREGFAACRYAIDRFKELAPTIKVETYAPVDRR